MKKNQTKSIKFQVLSGKLLFLVYDVCILGSFSFSLLAEISFKSKTINQKIKKYQYIYIQHNDISVSTQVIYCPHIGAVPDVEQSTNVFRPN